MDTYGTRLTDYSIKSSSKGTKLCRYIKNSAKDYTIGVIDTETNVKQGEINVKIWTLKNGTKYHYY